MLEPRRLRKGAGVLSCIHHGQLRHSGPRPQTNQDLQNDETRGTGGRSHQEPYHLAVLLARTDALLNQKEAIVHRGLR